MFLLTLLIETTLIFLSILKQVCKYSSYINWFPYLRVHHTTLLDRKLVSGVIPQNVHISSNTGSTTSLNAFLNHTTSVLTLIIETNLIFLSIVKPVCKHNFF